VLQTEALDWVTGRPCGGAGAPVLTISFGGAQSTLSLPTI
jgi:hypothetical protein